MMHSFRNGLLCVFIIACCLNLQAQTNVPVSAYKLIFEKVYLHTDRDQYAAGEDIWFKAYLVNPQNNQLFDASNNLYVELINADNKIAYRRLIRMDNGLGNGDFKLGETVKPGIYRIRAYTNWMRNFSDYFVFEKKITVLGPAVEKPDPDAESVVLKPGRRSKKQAPPAEEPPAAIPDVSHVRFFPEGGSLSDDITSLIAVKAEDPFGRGMLATGEVFASSGRLVAKFACDSLGMGLFTLTPDETQTYTAIVTARGQKHEYALPKALRVGFVLSLSQVDSTIVAAINCNSAALFSNAGQHLIVSARHANKIYYQDQIPVKSGNILVQIADQHIPEGITSVTVYDEHNIPLCERLIYVRHSEKAAALSLVTDKAIYQPKEKVTLKIKTNANAKLSVAVVDAGLVPVQAENIQAYLMLKSEVRGNIEHAERYFDTTNTNRFKQLDLLLMTQGWREFTWQRLADSSLKVSYMIERGLTISGKVKTIFTEKPAPNLNVTMYANRADGNKLFAAKTDDKGRFFIDGVNLYGNQNISLNAATDLGKKTAWIAVDTVTVDRYPVKKLAVIDTSAQLLKIWDALDNRLKTTKRFSVADTQHLNTVNITGLRISKYYGDTTIAVTRDDYKHEYFYNYFISKIEPWIKAQKASKLLRGMLFKNVFTSDSLQRWNTWRVNFFKIPMDKITSVTYKMVGLYQMPTIYQLQQGFTIDTGFSINFWIDLKVKAHAFDDFDFHVTNLDVDGYYKARTFYEPIYTAATTKPDVRTTIHWQPNVVSDEKGEATLTFYNADPRTKVRIVVEGLSKTGAVLAGSTVYEVK